MMAVGKGSVAASERKEFADPVSGARVTQLTDYLAHSNHPYFTESGWYDDGRRLAFISDRADSTNLFSIDLTSGEITQLTDIDRRCHTFGRKVSVNPVRDEAYYYVDSTLMAIDLVTLSERALHVRPRGTFQGATNATADGRYVVTYHVEDPTIRWRAEIGDDYARWVDYMEGRKGSSVADIRQRIFESHPLSTIVKVATDGSGEEVAYQENHFMGHVNTSPTLANIMTFCHEGPWHLVDNRIWGLDLATGKVWAIRPTSEGEAVGHEYWMADGEHLGYHGRTPNGPIYGAVRYDNTDLIEAPFGYGSTHFHSLALDYVVGDGSREDPYLLLWRFREGRFEGPKVLAWHRGSLQTGYLHIHPRFTADGRQVLYTADPQGYGQLFLVDVPEWDALPDRAGIR